MCRRIALEGSPSQQVALALSRPKRALRHFRVFAGMLTPLSLEDLAVSSAFPVHNRHGADRIRGRTVDDLRAYSHVDERVPWLVQHAINTSRLEEDARFLTEHLLLVFQFGQIDVDWANLPARHRKIGWIFVQTQRLTPAAFSGLRNMAR